MPTATRKKTYKASSKNKTGAAKTYKVEATITTEQLGADEVGQMFDYRLDDAMYDRDLLEWDLVVTEVS